QAERATSAAITAAETRIASAAAGRRSAAAALAGEKSRRTGLGRTLQRGARGAGDLDVAGDLAAGLDLDHPVADRPDHLAGGADEHPLADGERALEATGDLGRIDLRLALEEAALGDVDRAAVGQVGVDAALDHQLVARGDLARELDLAADDQLLLAGGQIGSGARRGRRGAQRHGGADRGTGR